MKNRDELIMIAKAGLEALAELGLGVEVRRGEDAAGVRCLIARKIVYVSARNKDDQTNDISFLSILDAFYQIT